MSQARIDDYLKRFDASVIGSSAEKREWHAELASSLEDAKESGDLQGALDRLGPPREAAASFRAANPLPLASLQRRFMAQGIDFLPIVVVAALGAAHQLAEGDGSFALGFPVGLVLSSADPLWLNVVRGLVAVWSWLGLAAIEAAWSGRTPGKALMGLRTVSDDGTVVTLGQAIARRWSILFGVPAWIDWAGALFTDRRQRLLDLLAHTIVVADPLRTESRPRVDTSEREAG